MQVAPLAAPFHLHPSLVLARIISGVNVPLTYIFRITYAVLCLTAGLESVVWSSSFNFIPIDIPGATSTQANGINDRGQIVGTFVDAGNQQHGFLQDKRRFTTIDAPNLIGEGFSRTVGTTADGINSRGDIVGNFSTFADRGEFEYGFLERKGAFSITAGGPLGIANPRDINNRGQIVGNFFGAGAGGFLRDTNGKLTTINVPGAGATSVFGINNRGDIVGAYGANRFAGNDHAFLLDKKGNLTTIDVPGARFTQAFGINDAGVIVGGFTNVSCLNNICSSDTHGFLYNDGAFTTVDVPGATFTTVTDINNAGLFVGLFRDATGLHGFVDPPATVPEPTSFFLFGSGLAGLWAWRRRIVTTRRPCVKVCAGRG